MIKTPEDIAKLLVKDNDTDFSQYGNVDVKQKDDLFLFSYTREAMYENTWNMFERLSRGLIINGKTGEIVARPFTKFFNWAQIVDGEKWVPRYSDYLVHVFEKIDGSLGILYRENGKHKIATRGSFDSNQAIEATKMLFNHNLSSLPDEITLLFEIIYPENRIVVDYKERKNLVLLGAINRHTGEELPFYPYVYQTAYNHDFALPTVYDFNNPTEVLEKAARLPGTKAEGFVLLYSDGSRYKIKGDEYLEYHRIISNLTEKNVFEQWQSSGDKVITFYPDEFRDTIKAFICKFENKRIEIEDTFNEIYDNAPKENRKELALYLRQYDKKYSTLAFLKYDGKIEEVEQRIKGYCYE